MNESPGERLRNATDAILDLTAHRKLVVAGPGTGKTYLFRKLLERAAGDKKSRLVLTFITTCAPTWMRARENGNSVCSSGMPREPRVS